MKKIRLGTIGTNFITDRLIEALETREEFILSAIYSRRAETGKAFSEKQGNVPYYADLEAFFASGIDAVYVASPNFCHFEQAKAALEHGKHVLLEKPACLTAAEFEVLAGLAQEKNLVLLEAMRPGHDPGVGMVKEAMKRLGTIRRVTLEFCQYSSRYDKFKAGTVLNAFNPAYGNAALMDIGCYVVHVLVMLFGAPEALESHSLFLGNGFEGQGHLSFTYPGFMADIHYSKITESVNPSVITGEAGSIVIPKISLMPEADLILRGQAPVKLFEKQDAPSNMIYELEDFARCIFGELSTAEFTENTRLTLKIMDEVREKSGIRFDI